MEVEVGLSVRSAHVWYDRRAGVTVRCDGRVVQSGVTVGWYSQVLRLGDTARLDGQVVQSGVTVR